MLHRIRRIRDLFIPCVFGLLVLIALVCLLAGCATSSGGPAGSGGTAGASTPTESLQITVVPSGSQGPADDGMATVAVADLPPQARTTMALIKAGGPFPYHQDGVVFQNRERLLPHESSGYYHEYTVETPGSADRGARRIIAARDGTLYYTSDHYESFQRIVQS
ncbi:ribonuclease domain-containing protein [Flexivirga oryzae]|uniref:Ribonuclease T1 n=1 Tax=Flexivirga oryzae TaxID=1794944 RepID=A0A839N5I4_9MICO|nr:ribonuclease [Flexivirga oryzae]MBB2892547.1 ribonuclease T1 [Flexivirga oryzae]